MEKALFAIKLLHHEKAAMDFSAKECDITLSKMYYPYINDGIHDWLGITMLFKLDINNHMPIERYISYFEKNLSSKSEGPSAVGADAQLRELGPISKEVPPIILTFLTILEKKEVQQRLTALFPKIEFQSSEVFLGSLRLKELVRDLGRQYLQRCTDFKKSDFNLMKEIYFSMMLKEYFRSTAVGSLKTLQSEWYSKRASINAMRNILIKEYNSLFTTKPIEAIQLNAGIKPKK
jgi:hypothetical protein